MTLPASKQKNTKLYIPFGGKRLEGLSSNIRTLRKKNSKDGERHSMDLDGKLTVLEGESAFRTRSRTVGDLISADDDVQTETYVAYESQISCDSGSSSNSNLSISSRNSAKLMHSSANPATHSSSHSSSSSVNDGDGSPIWKPRNETNNIHVAKRSARPASESCVSPPPQARQMGRQKQSERQRHRSVERPNVGGLVLQANPSTKYSFRDTEC